MFGIHPTHRLDMSVERLMREMDRCRIAGALTLSTVGIFHDHTRGNSITLEAAKANKRLVPVATVNPTIYFGSPADMQAIRAQGFRILKFYPAEQGWAVDSAAFGEVLVEAAALKIPVMVNASRSGEPTAVGVLAVEYPAPVILCSVSLDVLSEALAVMAKLPNVMLETHELHVPDALELIVDRVGADRVVFGSGAPRCSIASSLNYILSSTLSDDDKGRILGGNISRILEAA